SHGESRLSSLVIQGQSLGMISVDHVVAPASVPSGLQLQEVLDDVTAHLLVRVVEVSEIAVTVRSSSAGRVLCRGFFVGAALQLGSAFYLRTIVEKRFIEPANGRRVPRWIDEIGPVLVAVAMIDHDIGNRLDALVEKGLQHAAVLGKRPIAVAQLP